MKYDDLGETEVVTATQANPSRASAHIIALEKRVDDLEEETRLLKAELSAKPSTVTQEQYDDLCQRYQVVLKETIPF